LGKFAEIITAEFTENLASLSIAKVSHGTLGSFTEYIAKFHPAIGPGKDLHVARKGLFTGC
jgi:hypothetical protein